MKRLMVGIALFHGICPGADVSVNLDGAGIVPMKALLRAKWTVTSMFSAIGVRVLWSGARPSEAIAGCSGGEDAVAIKVRIIGRIDRSRERNGSVVHGETVIHASGAGDATIYYDGKLMDMRPELLGHVLVHEIGHALQGIARHSETGVMKATWTGKERNQMGTDALAFTPYDADLIRSSIARLSANSCAEAVLAQR